MGKPCSRWPDTPTALKGHFILATVAGLDLCHSRLLAGRTVRGSEWSPGRLFPHPFPCRCSLFVRYLGILLARLQPDGHVHGLVRRTSLDRRPMRVGLSFRDLPLV